MQRKPTPPPVSAQRQSLVDFMQSKKKADCLVCKLPKDVRKQLGTEAQQRGFSRANQVEWLRAACGATGVSLDILNKHLGQHHDREEDFNG